MPVTMAQANRALKQLPEDAKHAVQDVMDASAFQIASSAAREVPVGSDHPDGSPHLRDAIDWKRMDRSTSAVVRVDSRAHYWKFLEYGTVKMSAIGMFRRAGEKIRDGHRSRLLAALARANSKLPK